jgi:hypothetical protein
MMAHLLAGVLDHQLSNSNWNYGQLHPGNDEAPLVLIGQRTKRNAPSAIEFCGGVSRV